MDIDEITALVAGLSGVVSLVPGAGSAAPEIAWGDTFFLYNPAGDEDGMKRQAFATIVTKDYPGWDESSQLDRPGMFRVNLAVGRSTFGELLGYPPQQHAEHRDDIDYTVVDRLLPHPQYASQGWVSVLNPGPATSELVGGLLLQAYALDVSRYQRRRSGS